MGRNFFFAWKKFMFFFYYFLFIVMLNVHGLGVPLFFRTSQRIMKTLVIRYISLFFPIFLLQSTAVQLPKVICMYRSRRIRCNSIIYEVTQEVGPLDVLDINRSSNNQIKNDTSTNKSNFSSILSVRNNKNIILY